MDKKELLEILNYFSEMKDIEQSHVLSDQALLDYINDKDISEAFDCIEKWYS